MLVEKRVASLGWASTVIVPVAASSGPAAPIVIAAVAIDAFAAFLVHHFIGTGRREADFLTKPGQGIQWKLEHEVLPAIIDPYTAAKESGTLTAPYLDNLVAALEHLRDGFVHNAQVFKKAGPGAIETITHVINDILLPDVKAQYSHVRQDIEPLPVDGDPTVTVIPEAHPTIHVIRSTMDWSPWIVVGVMLLAFKANKERR